MTNIRVNGVPLDSLDGVIMKPNDRICIGPSAIFVFKNKQKEDEASMPDPDDDPISFDFANEEVVNYDTKTNKQKKEEEAKKEEEQQQRRRPIHADPMMNHPTCWHRIRSTFPAHPAFGHRFHQTILLREQCVSSRSTPVVHGRMLTRQPLPKPFDPSSLRQEQLHPERGGGATVLVDLPVGPIECPVCKGQPGRLGRSGCPACWRNPITLPWTFPPRTMPGVEQGYSVTNLQFQSLLRIRKRGDERVSHAKNTRRELPSVSGTNTSGGDLEKDRATADLCTHTPFYCRPALSLHRIKHESDLLRIIIRNLPDDGVLVEMIVCPHVTTLAHLNLLYVANCADPTAGLCLEGRISPLVLVVPTEEGAYHIDLRQENVTDLHGFYNFSPGSSTTLSELRFGTYLVEILFDNFFHSLSPPSIDLIRRRRHSSCC